MKVAIEGMDGVGKSTIAKMIAANYNMIYLEKPLKDLFETSSNEGSKTLAEISKKIYKFDNEILKAWFFGMGNLYSFLNHENDDLVIDRHFASNYFWNGTPSTKTIFANMIELIGVPDTTIVLSASPNTRMERLYNRNPNDYDLTDSEKNVMGYDKILSFLREFDIPHSVVDTEGKTIEEVYSEVSSIVMQVKKEKVVKRLGK